MNRVIDTGTPYEYEGLNGGWTKAKSRGPRDLGRPYLERGGWSYFKTGNDTKVRIRSSLCLPPKIVRQAMREFDATIINITEPRRKSYG